MQEFIHWFPALGFRPANLLPDLMYPASYPTWMIVPAPDADAPYVKFDARALIDAARFDGHMLPANSYAMALANDRSAPPAAVPLDASAVFLLIAMAALAVMRGR